MRPQRVAAGNRPNGAAKGWSRPDMLRRVGIGGCYRPPMEVLVSDVAEYLADWIVRQRWYAGKARAPRFELLGSFTFGQDSSPPAMGAGPDSSPPASGTGPDSGAANDPDHAVLIRDLFVLDHAEHPQLYQVPVTERRSPVAGLEHALVAIVESAGGPTWIYDGPHDPAYAEAVLRLILTEGEIDASTGAGRVTAHGHCDLLERGLRIVSSRVLSGEQSNTSIVYQLVDPTGQPARPVICKIFRALHDGENPDVILTAVLALAAPAVVPECVGHVTGQWSDSGKPDGFATGHVAFAQEFLPGAEDAWRVAILAVDIGEDFSVEARQLGETTAIMHAALAGALPTRATTPSDIAVVIESMRGRFELAAKDVPALATHRAALEQVYRRAEESAWPDLQRIHGDLHLGQVLAVPGRGWVVLDFEGEPLRPMSERSQLDIPLRDVAGMLRSFDYVAGSYEHSHDGLSAADWASACRTAFLDGYIGVARCELASAVLDAFEIDKALYEAVYEARNRPAWLGIPIAAITRLLARAAATA
jgi:maltokinase